MAVTGRVGKESRTVFGELGIVSFLSASGYASMFTL